MTIPLELEVLDATMPAHPIRTWLFYGRDDLANRMGEAETEASANQLLALLHRHRVTGFDSVNSVADVRRDLPALDGSLYTAGADTRGPAAGVGDGLVVLGAYGTFHAATPEHLGEVEAIADELGGARDVRSCRGRALRRRRAVRLGRRRRLARPAGVVARRERAPGAGGLDLQRRSRTPAGRRPDRLRGRVRHGAGRRRARGREGGLDLQRLPAGHRVAPDRHAGESICGRSAGSRAAAGISRWFIWNTDAWSDGNRGGHGPFDPFVTAATGHNDDEGSTLMGDGLLVYPGTPARSVRRALAGLLRRRPFDPAQEPPARDRGRRLPPAGARGGARRGRDDRAERSCRASWPRRASTIRRPGATRAPPSSTRARRWRASSRPAPTRVRAGASAAGPRPRTFHVRRRYRVLLRVGAGMLIVWAGRAVWGGRRNRAGPT